MKAAVFEDVLVVVVGNAGDSSWMILMARDLGKPQIAIKWGDDWPEISTRQLITRLGPRPLASYPTPVLIDNEVKCRKFVV